MKAPRKTSILTAALVIALLAPIVLVGSGGDPRTFWGELRRAVDGALVAQAVSTSMPIPFGGDDTGTVLTLVKRRIQCQNAVVKNFSRLVKCILKCHATAANAIFNGKSFDEEACESADPVKSCRAKYDAVSTQIVGKGCPNCLNFAQQAKLADDIESSLDANNQNFYCYP